ncbi:Protein enhanced disease resistance 2-like [Vitis vinifera]|uniref:Protein enhanced disease resistance 2-like n=1 Tax=Vitis vinifera TaxID=29760 RepID=A0A438I5F9_VITVI|nr:Protein enhanced disease resistance 2-like [Vitis vinifera]
MVGFTPWRQVHGKSPDYFSTRIKIPGGECLLKPLGFDWIRGSTKIWEILNHPNSRVRKALEEEFPEGDKPFVWAFNLQVPNKDNYSAVAYFLATEPIPEGSLMEQFLKGDDGFRNSRLKLIANIVQGPWIVRKAVGEQAICIIGRALTCKYCVSDNFIEVDVDIGSSMVASAIVHLAFGYITTLTVDLAFLIESQTESELPERILGAVRFSELNPASARPLKLQLRKPLVVYSPLCLQDYGNQLGRVSPTFFKVLLKVVLSLVHLVPMGLLIMKKVEKT